MRLIDADQLKKYAVQRENVIGEIAPCVFWSDIENAETVQTRDIDIVCSKCGHVQSSRLGFNFCAKCGARVCRR